VKSEISLDTGARAGSGVGIFKKNKPGAGMFFFSFYRSQIIAFNKFEFSLSG